VSAKSTISASLVRVSVSVGGRKRSASGVVIRADGYILTSAAFAAGHGPKLADTDTPFEITTSTGSPATARLIGVDPGTGLAVLRAVGQFEPATFVATGEAAGSLVADTARLGMVLINSRGQIVALYPSPSSPHPVPADAVLRAAVGMIAAATMH
jgi:S1-C subfamily serine protease